MPHFAGISMLPFHQGMDVLVQTDNELTDQMAWVRAMNNIRNRAEEIVLKELINGEDAE